MTKTSKTARELLAEVSIPTNKTAIVPILNGSDTVYFFRGNFRTLQKRGEFELDPVPQIERRGDRSPTHKLMMADRFGEMLEVGAAWVSIDERKGAPSVSCSIDDPDLSMRFNIFAANDWNSAEQKDGAAYIGFDTVTKRARQS